jgi:hypothetical protein
MKIDDSYANQITARSAVEQEPNETTLLLPSTIIDVDQSKYLLRLQC